MVAKTLCATLAGEGVTTVGKGDVVKIGDVVGTTPVDDGLLGALVDAIEIVVVGITIVEVGGGDKDGRTMTMKPVIAVIKAATPVRIPGKVVQKEACSFLVCTVCPGRLLFIYRVRLSMLDERISSV